MVMRRSDARLGELVLTPDEHSAILALVHSRADGTLPPGFVTLVVDVKDRLSRFHDGIARILYQSVDDVVELCVASIHTCPVIMNPGEHTLLSRYCFRGNSNEWWIILPGGRMMFITPEQPLRPGYDVVVTLEVLESRKPSRPNLITPFTSKNGRVDVSVLGVS